MRGLDIFLLVFSVISLGSAMEVVYMDEWCDQTYFIDSSPSYRIKLTSSSEYPSNFRCTFTVSGDYLFEDQLMIQFKDLSIENDYECSNDWLSLYDGDDKDSPTIGPSKWCGQDTPSAIYTTTGDSLTFYFQSDDSVQYDGFDIILTHFKEGYCDSWEITCDNGRCIDDSLRCSGNNPCGDFSDCQLSIGQISGIAVGGFAFVVVVVVVVVIVMRRRRRRYVTASPVMPVSVATTVGHVPYQGYNQPVPPKYGAFPQAPPPYTAGNQPTSGLLTSYPPPPAYSN